MNLPKIHAQNYGFMCSLLCSVRTSRWNWVWACGMHYVPDQSSTQCLAKLIEAINKDMSANMKVFNFKNHSFNRSFLCESRGKRE